MRHRTRHRDTRSVMTGSAIIRSATLATVTLLGASGCSAAAEAPVTTAATQAATPDGSAAPTSAPSTSAPVATPTPIPAAPEAPVSTETTITITVDGTPVSAVLQNNAATESLLAQLPLELSFDDYGGQEKIAGIPEALNLDGLPSGGSAEPGTLGYYAPDQAIVLYYDAVGYYEGIIPLGTFDGVAVVRDSPPFTGTIAVAG